MGGLGVERLVLDGTADTGMFRLPHWFLDLSVWELLLQASERTQLPILRMALGLATMFSGDAAELNGIKNHILAKCITQIMRDDTSSPSKHDRIIGILQRFCAAPSRRMPAITTRSELTGRCIRMHRDSSGSGHRIALLTPRAWRTSPPLRSGLGFRYTQCSRAEHYKFFDGVAPPEPVDWCKASAGFYCSTIGGTVPRLDRLRRFIAGMTSLVDSVSQNGHPAPVGEGSRLLAALVKHDDWLLEFDGQVPASRLRTKSSVV